MSSYSYEVDPTSEFAKEILEIKNSNIRMLVIEALERAPQYFFFVPASSSGKYHSKNNLGMGGLVRHTKEVFWLSEHLLSHPTLGKGFTDKEKDYIRAAIILHDSCKQGFEDSKRTVFKHPLLVRSLIPDEDLSDLKEEWHEICNIIDTHMGPWTTNKETGKKELPEPNTDTQVHVHMCDYIASRKNINVDYPIL